MVFEKILITDFHLKGNINLALSRLGYNKTKQNIDKTYLDLLHEVNGKALKEIEPVGVYKVFSIKDIIELCPELKIITDFLCCDFINENKFKYLAFMGVTLGKAIDERIDYFFDTSEYTKAITLDSVASVLADEAMDVIFTTIKKNKCLDIYKNRMSPGHPLIPIEFQSVVYDQLNLNTINIGINNKLMLYPQKSIISLAFATDFIK